MSYKTILCILSDLQKATSVLNVGVPLAERDDAHLMGLHVIPDINALGYGAYQVPQSVLDDRRDYEVAMSARINELFNERTRGLKHKSEFREEWGSLNTLVDDIVPHAALADLVITATAQEAFSPATEDSAAIALQSGRPVLVVPRIDTEREIGNRIVVAWNGSPQASRAVFDSLPLLKKAEKVFVLVLDPDEMEEGKNFTGGDQIAASLARHDVNVETLNVDSGNLDPTEELLMRVEANGCDLVVMGCYGRAHWRELIFGGMTHNMLKNTNVPVLMSH